MAPIIKVSEETLDALNNLGIEHKVLSNINPQDYIQIPNTNIIISKYEPDEFKGLNWQDTHFKLHENGLFMPSPALFMPYFKNVIDAYNNKTHLFDGTGNQINKKEIKDIYKHLTTDYINGGAWAWLDALFTKDQNKWYLETNHKVVNNNLKAQTKQPLEQCLMEDCYVKLEFNKQGLATEKSSKQKYKQGKNIRYWHPRENAVVGFGALSDWADLGCDRYPGNSGSSLGVFACAEGAR